MKLPNSDESQVNCEKITDYLLCGSHPDGCSKAIFFKKFGFKIENWKIFAEALRKHGASHPVAKTMESNYGIRYNIEGMLETPDGRNPKVRTVWIIEKETNVPRLITAHPL